MKRLKNGSEIYEADKIVFKGNTMTGWSQEGDVLFCFKGVRNFESFELLDAADWDEAEPDPAEQVEDLKRRLAGTEIAILGLMELTAAGGDSSDVLRSTLNSMARK
ncbi:hypothetical protein [Jeotgalibacillus campisalis]|uniref:Uncharacterized protein n=1 Tax=Jeotgalibacillus campisalis TaxID=220754 RepID=A0A0C2R7C7_9BACL|nr:hypothetical protein [Jeotgalibacillus campisalis]KIL46150.1 hypothetical protein KR50_28250 [Jeotgalibacillus campisalis]